MGASLNSFQETARLKQTIRSAPSVGDITILFREL